MRKATPSPSRKRRRETHHQQTKAQQPAFALLKAIKRILLFLLRLVKLHHALLEGLPGAFSPHAHLALLLDSLQAGAGIVLAQADELVFEPRALLPPAFHLGLGAVGRRLEVDERLLQRGCQLLLGEEVLLDGADTRFLFFDDLGQVRPDVLRGMS